MTPALSPALSPTAQFLQALKASPFAKIDARGVPTIQRKWAGQIASDLGLDFPRWYANGKHFNVVDTHNQPVRGWFWIPEIAECVALGVGYPEARTGSRVGRPKSSGVRQAKIRVPRAVAPAVSVPPTVAMETLVRSDVANTAIQQSVSSALGVDVLLGASESIPYMPTVSATYVRWGHFEDLRTVVASGHFLPTMIVGPSGNGKTDLCEQVCASLNREYVRVNITNQTDEDDLLGGFRLVSGDTKFALGPIPMAMLRGAVINLDEIDLGGAALMCLQPVLEGKPLYLKKIGRYINPAPGFTIVATANTKGRGDDGKYAHTTIMNEAMLERFAIMLEQGWADAASERKIIAGVLKKYQKYDAVLVKHLVEWASLTRNNYDQQLCPDQIATRRLIHACQAFCALGNIDKAIRHTLSRFDGQTAKGFLDLWNAIHETVLTNSPSGAEVEAVPVEPAVVV